MAEKINMAWIIGVVVLIIFIFSNQGAQSVIETGGQTTVELAEIETFSTQLQSIAQLQGLVAKSCTDSDGGKDVLIRGTTIQDYIGQQPDEYIDTCISTSVVKEYYCLGTIAKSQDMGKSGHHCVNGRFKPDCKDTDGGKNYDSKGTVTSENGKTYTDFCVTDEQVKEYYCSGNNVLSSQATKSGYNCVGGQFVKKTGDAECIGSETRCIGNKLHTCVAEKFDEGELIIGKCGYTGDDNEGGDTGNGDVGTTSFCPDGSKAQFYQDPAKGCQVFNWIIWVAAGFAALIALQMFMKK